MKKINSTFKTAFLSEAGTELVNNDYFAFIELDDYACYVLADGITDASTTGAAKYAVETILSRFQEDPSLSSRKIRSWLKAANTALLEAYQYNRLKSSVIVMVTDYEKMRYAAAGNVRLRLFRGQRLLVRSADMSLAGKLVDQQAIGEDALSRHAERSNLYCYLGQDQDFKPYLSRKMPLKDGDIAALYTRGLWENVDEQEIGEVFADASDDPQKSIDEAEDLLLSRMPAQLENYTIAAVFIDQVFKDPLRDMKRRRRWKIAIITLIVLLLIGLGIFLWRWHRASQREDLDRYTQQTVTLIDENNFPRAQKSCEKARELADSLKDENRSGQLDAYASLIDAILQADAAYRDKDYQEAYGRYQEAMEVSGYADGLGRKYIARRMAETEKHLSVADLVAMGDQLAQDGDLDKAESRYLEARAKAAETHSIEDRQLVDNALLKFYELKAKSKKESDDKAKKAVADTITDYIAMGEALQRAGDLTGAEKKFVEARNIASAGGDDAGRKAAMAALDKLAAARDKKIDGSADAAQLSGKGDAALAAGDVNTAMALYMAAADRCRAAGDQTGAAAAEAKLAALSAKQSDDAAVQSDAAALEQQAEQSYAGGDLYGAKQLYLRAQGIYQRVGNQAKITAIQNVLEQIDTDIAIAESSKH